MTKRSQIAPPSKSDHSPLPSESIPPAPPWVFIPENRGANPPPSEQEWRHEVANRRFGLRSPSG
jgi:hypothetical protein